MQNFRALEVKPPTSRASSGSGILPQTIEITPDLPTPQLQIWAPLPANHKRIQYVRFGNTANYHRKTHKHGMWTIVNISPIKLHKNDVLIRVKMQWWI